VTEIVDFQSKKRQMAAKRGFKSWTSRFSERFDENTRFRDVSDHVLSTLIKGGEVSSLPVYDLVMGIQGLGSGFRFHDLEVSQKMVVMDVAIFLLDQFRFEAMRRLGWLEDDPLLDVPIFDAVEQYATRFAPTRHQAPRLAASHPRFPEYETAFGSDRHAVVRRLIPEAIEIYEQKVGKEPDH
jgi:hypothetical protein